MKKDKETASKEPEEVEDTSTDVSSTDDSDIVASAEPAEDLEALKLGEIESTEVVPKADEDVSADPDKEVTFVAPKPTMPVWYKRRKITLPIGIIGALVVLSLIPIVRMAVLGLVWHKSVTVVVTDTSQNNAPVSNAMVKIGGESALTDGSGKAVVANVPLGSYDVSITKTYYTDTKERLSVDVLTSGTIPMKLLADGKVVSAKVTDKITGAALSGAIFSNGDETYGKTASDGKVNIIVPYGKKSLDVSVSYGGYNVLKSSVSVSSSDFQLVTTGSIYRLTKENDKYTIVKSDFDGANEKVVVEGSGYETDKTFVYASHDWKHVVFRAKRTPNGSEQLYAINTDTDKYQSFDDTEAFTPIGWSGHFFYYESTNTSQQDWQSKTTAVKVYDAEKQTTTTVDENASVEGSTTQGAVYQKFGNYVLNDSRLLYSKVWVKSGTDTSALKTDDKKSAIVQVNSDGSSLKTIKSFDITDTSAIDMHAATPKTAVVRITDAGQTGYTYGQVDATGAYTDKTSDDSYVTKASTYSVSPDGTKTLWGDTQAGSTTLYVGDATGDDKQQVGSQTNYQVYGWATNTIILLKKDDTIYATTVTSLQKGHDPVKLGVYQASTPSLAEYGGL